MISLFKSMPLFVFLVIPSLIAVNSSQPNPTLRKLADRRATNKNVIPSTQFAFLFLNNLGSMYGNVFFSPISLQILLNMLLIGARNSTENQLKTSLGYLNVGLANNEQPHVELNKVIAQLTDANENQVELDIANTIVLQKDYNVFDEFKEKIVKFYDAEIKEANFSGSPDNATKMINDYVREKTREKIEKLLRNNLPSDTRLFLASVIYFKGLWKQQFDSQNTKMLEFYNEGRQTDPKVVPFMREKLTIPFANFKIQETTGKAIEIPYAGDKISMLILLPDKLDGAGQLQRSLTFSTLRAIINQMKTRKVWVEMPKFELTADYDLIPILKRMGISEIFDQNRANLKGISTADQLYVNKALHKAVIQVTETGTEAAAVGAAAVAVRIGIRLSEAVLDHPFIFVIRDTGTGMILFVGRVSQL